MTTFTHTFVNDYVRGTLNAWILLSVRIVAGSVPPSKGDCILMRAMEHLKDSLKGML